MKFFAPLLALAALLLTAGASFAAERIPPAPAKYFNDYANVVSVDTANALNTKLEQYERTTSNQLLVALFPRMESDSSVQDYTVRVAEAWRVGQAKRDNGAVLFLFMKEREVFIQVGYGLESVLPDATAKRIIENEIVPRFRRGDIDGGMRAAVDAMIAATKGEYQGTGRTQADRSRGNNRGVAPSGAFIGLVVVMILLSQVFRGARRNTVFGSPRVGRRSSGGFWMGPPQGGGGWSGGGGGGFSGGGGSFGGGGAGGRW
ncbi:TPM domain-containing protein [Oleiharenicola lentus]|uniref:TPM domain-containing protein n=1 Tax=Oleiharenicola lentus TaxID=2508720 RepID=UPI003F66A6D7